MSRHHSPCACLSRSTQKTRQTTSAMNTKEGHASVSRRNAGGVNPRRRLGHTHTHTDTSNRQPCDKTQTHKFRNAAPEAELKWFVGGWLRYIQTSGDTWLDNQKSQLSPTRPAETTLEPKVNFWIFDCTRRERMSALAPTTPAGCEERAATHNGDCSDQMPSDPPPVSSDACAKMGNTSTL